MFAKISRTAKTPGTRDSAAPPYGTPVPSAVAMPPFWELEELIAQGYATADALTIMASRHAEGAFPLILSGDGAAAAVEPDNLRLSA